MINIDKSLHFDRLCIKAVTIDSDKQTWSPQLLDLLGLKGGSFAPSAELFMSFVHPEDQPILRELLASLDLTVRPETLFRIVRRDGLVKLVSLVPSRAPDGSGPKQVWLLDYSCHLQPADGPDLAMGRIDLAGHLAAATWMMCEPGADMNLSRGARDIVGLGEDERFTGAQLLRHLSADHQAVVSHAMEVASDKGRVARAVFAFARLDDGESLLLELTVAAARDRDGRRLALWGTLADVTAQVRRHRDLMASEALITTVLARIEDGAVVLDPGGRVVRMNEVARRLLGLEAEESGLTLWELCPSLLGDKFYQDFRLAAERGRATEQERYIPPLKQWIQYSFAPLGTSMLVILKRRDEIYEQRALFHELSDRCNTALTWGRITIWEIETRTDRIWYSNPEGGLAGAGVMTLGDFLATLRPEDLAAVERAKQAAISDGASFDIDVGLVTRQGETRRVRLRGGPDAFTGRSSRLRGVVIELRDSGGDTARKAASPRAVALPLIGAQVRAARGALRWSVRELSERSAVSVATVNRFEAGSRTVAARDSSVAALQRVLVAQGISFFADPNGYPAISLTPTALVTGQAEDDDTVDGRSRFDPQENTSARLNS